ncbi:hypothetical protein L596_020822 [Steinernema carpocapsae]|uniref:T-box domain-containing protein n=1 Tax=Steinernema carpocapsae TaxID=34508 RepID=A0A4U5MUQ1_STECR|nr:hypothetical protein L596_020822 [Steinernema carpocapsae]
MLVNVSRRYFSPLEALPYSRKTFHSHQFASGKKMFPNMMFRVSGLIPSNHYLLAVSFRRVDEYRYKYSDYKWSQMGKGEPIEESPLLYPREGVQSGEIWNKQETVKFDKVKLTNTNTDIRNAIVSLKSMHKYRPYICVLRVNGDKNDQQPLIHNPQTLVAQFEMPLMDFIAVTAYNNDQLKSLKVDNNKYAKGFRQDGKHTQKRYSTEENSQQIKKPVLTNNIRMHPPAMNPTFMSPYGFPAIAPQSLPMTQTMYPNQMQTAQSFYTYPTAMHFNNFLPMATQMTYQTQMQTQQTPDGETWQPNVDPQLQQLPMTPQNQAEDCQVEDQINRSL